MSRPQQATARYIAAVYGAIAPAGSNAMLTRDEARMLTAVLYTPPLEVDVFINDTEHCELLGYMLYHYLQHRAAREEIGFELMPAFFTAGIKRGCSRFFGVSYTYAGIFSDEQEPSPGFLAAYLSDQGSSLTQQQEYAIGAHVPRTCC